ncbi:hypothetical protein E2C01_059144 [Portunus trituberculatus]|uniref:Uncharacterized protein n=1 Tax=Portunus trituberculatus TaxID=210409 RepID=A0A5B7GXA6_PORTR|nr:hypothetical protein [Portunus trituberculatus]
MLRTFSAHGAMRLLFGRNANFLKISFLICWNCIVPGHTERYLELMNATRLFKPSEEDFASKTFSFPRPTLLA